jgi:predicted DsbA family dithiol-disulfide isomerase
MGVSSTPTFLIGTAESDGRVRVVRRVPGAQPFTAFAGILDDLLKAGPAAN